MATAKTPATKATSKTPTPDLSEARRLLAAGLHLVPLHRNSKRPVGLRWNSADKCAKEINPEATGYGMPLALNGLCSIDPDNVEAARIGLQALGFDLDDLMTVGVRTTSTRPGSGGRSTFMAAEGLGWVKFSSKATGTALELRARSPNLQDTVPGIVYTNKDGTETYTQQYANGRCLDEAPEVPTKLREWWARCSTDVEFLRDQQTKFFAALGIDINEKGAVHLAISAPVRTNGKGSPLAFPAPGLRLQFNAEHPVEEILAEHGYTQDGNRWAPPTATGSAGVRPIPGKDGLWQSDHASDPLFGTFDAWTAHVVLDHGGDLQSAITANGGVDPEAAIAKLGAVMGARKDAPPSHQIEPGEPDEPKVGPGSPDLTPSEAEMLAEYTQRVWTLDELMADGVMLQDGAQVTFLSRPWIALPFGTAKILLGASANVVINKKTGTSKRISRLDIWNVQPSRMEVWGRTHAPGREVICTDPLGRKCVNLWRPISHTPPKNWKSLVKPFLDHIAFLVPLAAERELFLDWLAHIEQQPGTRPHTHFLLRTRGGQGVGRNWVGGVLSRVWVGNVAGNVDLMGMLAGGFNGLVASSLLGIVDELHVELGGVSLPKLTEALKGEMTAERRNVKPKYGREYVEWCCTRWLMFSNHVAALPLPREDRRVVVVENPNKGKDASYYTHLYGLLEDGDFIAAVREFLIRRDISKFNPGAHAPMNDAKQETTTATTSVFDMAAADIAENWPSDVILSADMFHEMADNGEGPSGPWMRQIAMRAGMRSHPKRIKFGGKHHTCWYIRNHEKWMAAPSDLFHAEIRRGREGARDDERLIEARERLKREASTVGLRKAMSNKK